MKRLITEQDVTAAHAAGKRALACNDAIITPSAWTRARELGVALDAPAESQRTAEKAAVTVVRGSSVRLGAFPPHPNVKLTDVITASDGSPMAAGFMSWRKEDSFPWHLTYDEIDYVLEGVLQIGELYARAGDVVYIPKGSKIVFGTPSRVKLFYVTYPASWDAPRPQK